MNILTDYLDIAAEESAAALATANGDGLADGEEFAQSRHMDEILELAEYLNRAAAICRKPGVADLLAGRVHSRRLRACVQQFDDAPAQAPAPAQQPHLRDRILAHLADGPDTARRICDALGVSLNSGQSCIYRMIKTGQLTSNGKRPATYSVADSGTHNLNPGQAAIMRVLERGPATLDALVQALGYTRSYTRDAAGILARAGLVKSDGKRPASYRLAEESDE